MVGNRFCLLTRPLVLAAILLAFQPAFGESGREMETSDVDAAVSLAMTNGLVSGAVVCVGTKEGVSYTKAYGNVTAAAGSRSLDLGDIFDIASLTKVVATAPVVLKLAEQGVLKLNDPLGKWLRGFEKRDKKGLLLKHLLTHSSGLRDVDTEECKTVGDIVGKAAREKTDAKAGSSFQYADINFILLAEVVRRATGVGIDAWAERVVFGPLEMRDSGYLPSLHRVDRCVPTSDGRRGFLVGRVQDPLANRLGGVAGHAGVFATAFDLSRFCRMMLNGGGLEGRRILSSASVAQMVSPRTYYGGAVLRGLGWDLQSPYSSPKGLVFSAASFGHTGYTGGSIWIDPAQDAFVILLTARMDYRRTREFNEFRSEVSSCAADMLSSRRRGAGTRAIGG